MDHTMLIIVIFLPLIPAYVLFKYLNSKASVQGKVLTGFLKDVRVDLGGGFAAYFVLVAVLLYYFEYQRVHPEEEVWLVKGRLLFEQESKTLSYTNIQTMLLPPPYSPSINGSFEISVVVPIKRGKLDFPVIQFQHPNFKPIVLDLDEAQTDKLVSIDDEAKKVSLKQELVLKYQEQ